MPVFPEILSRLLISSESIITSPISALDGSLNQVSFKSAVGILSLFQPQKAIQAQVYRKSIVRVLLDLNWGTT